MRLAQHLKTLLPILLLVFTVSGAVNAKVVSEAQNLTLVGSDIPAGGLVGEDLESAITAGIQVERFNRQLHLKEAIALKGEKDRIETSDLSAAEKKARIDRLEAVSCHFVRCSEGVSEEDAGYEVLAERQAWGAQLAKDNDLAYQAIARHYHNGLFVYTDTDHINDFLTRHESGVARTLGAGQSLTATIGTVGGVAFTVASAPTCPTSGVGCALTVGSVIFTGLEAARFIEGLSDIFGDYELSSGQNVLDSFDDPKNHPGDVNPLGDVLKAAGISVVEVGVGKLLVKTSSGVRAVIDRFGGKKPRCDDVTKGGVEAAKRLGVKLDNIPINNGVARTKIDISLNLDPKDINQLKDVLRSRGATRAEVDTGFIVNEKLDGFLRRRVQDGKQFNGGTVRFSNSKNSDFTIDFDL